MSTMHVESATSDEFEASSESKRTTLSAEEALEKLRRGQILENIRVERLVFKGEFTEPIRLKHCTLVRPRFDSATFRADVALNACTIDRVSFGKPTQFDGGLSLNGSTLVKCVVQNLSVKGLFSADLIVGRGKLQFLRCRFQDRSRFWDARFECWLDFKDCEFAGEADFRSLHAAEGLVLRNCIFHGNFLFRGASVSKKFDLAKSTFEGLLDFSKAKLHDYVYLESIQQGANQKFAFLNALGDRVLVRLEQLVGRLASECEGRYHDAMHEYAFLKRAFASLHRYDEEDWAFYRFKVNQRRGRPRSWLRPWTKFTQFGDWLFLDHGCGYCTDPYRALRAAAVIIVAFGLIYAAGIELLHVDKRPFADEPITSLANRTVAGMFTSVSVFTSGLGSLKEAGKGWMNLPLIVESLLGTLLWGLFIVAFSRKVIR